MANNVAGPFANLKTGTNIKTIGNGGAAATTIYVALNITACPECGAELTNAR